MNRSLLLSLLLVIGCRREAPEATGESSPALATASRSSSPSSSELGKRVAELGDGAPFVFVIHPDHWGQARPHLAAMLAAHPDAKARAIGAATDANALLSALLDATKSSRREYDSYAPIDDELWDSSYKLESIALTGWDSGRPIVMALGEPPVDGPPGAALAAYLGRTELEPQRHQISIPATDDEALVAALGRVLDELGKPAPELVEGREGARAWRAGLDYVAVLPQETSVRLVVLAGTFGEPTPARLAAWKARLDPTPASLPDTPALALTVASEPLAAMLVRTWRLRGWSTWNDFHEVGQALQVVSRDQTVGALAVGGSIAMSPELVMSQRGVDVDDWAFALVADDTSLRLRAVASLTPSGRKGWDEALGDACAEAKAGATAAGTLPSLEASQFLALAMLQRQPGVGPALAEIFQNCGPMCMVHVVSTHPFGMVPRASCSLLEGHRAVAAAGKEESRGDPSVLPLELFEAPGVAELLRPIREVRWQTRRDGDALVNETVLAFGEAAPAAATSPGGKSWDSPLGAELLGPRDECMVELIEGLREGLERLGRDEPAMVAKGVTETLTKLAPALECASKDSEPEVIAKALRSAFVGLAARSLDDAYLGSSARVLLEESCRDHEDAAACSRVEAMRSRPERAPLALAEASECEPERLFQRGVLTISMTTKGTWLGETDHGTDLAALERALVAERGAYGVITGVVVFADPSLTAAQARPTLDVLARAGVSELGVVVSEAGAARRILPMTLVASTPSSAAGEVEEEPPTGESGSTPKKGLYAMKGPGDSIPRMLRGGPTTVLYLGTDGVELRTAAGATIPLRGSTPAERRAAVETANVESGSLGLTVELDAAAPWSRLALALETSCSVELRLAAP